MSALAGSFFLASSRAHWRIPAILSGTLMMILALSACTHSSAAAVSRSPVRPPHRVRPQRRNPRTIPSAILTQCLAHGARHQHRRAGAARAGQRLLPAQDSDGNEDFRGCYFADSDAIVSLANLSRNLVIYGHTFTDGWDGGFAQLDKYLDADWALEHTDIQVEIGGSVLTYEVCSVGFCNTEETSLPIYCNLDDEAYRYLIEDANNRNEVLGLQKLSPTDSILTLATCTENENIRLVVVAKQKYDTIGTSKEDES